MSLPLEQAQFTINNLLQQHARGLGGVTNTGTPGYGEAMAKARYEAMLRHARGVYDSAGDAQMKAQEEMQARAQHEQDMRRQMEDEQFRRQQMMMDLQRQHQDEMMRRGDSTIPGGNANPFPVPPGYRDPGGSASPMPAPPWIRDGMKPESTTGAADPNWVDPTGGNMYAPMLSNPGGLVTPPVQPDLSLPPGKGGYGYTQTTPVMPPQQPQAPIYTTPVMPPSLGFTPTTPVMPPVMPPVYTTPVTPPLFKGTEMATGITSTKPAGDAGFMPWGAGRTNVMAGGNAFGGFGASTKPTTDTWHPDTSYNQASRNAGYGSGSNPAWMNFMGGAPPPVLDQRYNNYVSAFGSPTWTANG